ncbi:MAG: hypothetical protein U1F27_01560 [Turneriella sp.]
MPNVKNPILTLFIMAVLSGAITAQDDSAAATATPAASAGGCTAQLNGYRPRVYVANFYVTYGKKDMGRLIGDYIAKRFEADGRFDVVSREEIEDRMRPLFKGKLPAEKYLQTTVELAAEQRADCVIFGRISKAGSKRAAFLVRMASVQTGENLSKVDTEVDRKDALAFLEGIGDSFVSYFQAAPAPVIAAPAEPKHDRHHGFYLSFNGGGGYYDISTTAGTVTIGLGGPATHLGAKLGIGLGGHVVLFGMVDLYSAVDPTLRASNSTSSASATTSNTKLTGNMFGGGLAIYSSSNFFIAGSVGIAQATLSYTSGTTTYSGSTDTGIGTNLQLGQEWAVSKDWAIGVALTAHYSSLPDHGVTWTQIYGGLAVTATYN